MIGVDTNVVLRLLLADDRDQLAKTQSALDAAGARRESVYVGPIVFAEAAWTLARRRRVPREELCQALGRFSSTRPFKLFDAAQANAALACYSNGPADFSDCLIGAMNAAAGCRTTLTFDADAAQLPEFTALV